MIENAGSRAVPIRPAVAPDLDAIARIWFDGWRSTGLATASDDDPTRLRERIDRELASGWALFVATVDETVVGMLALKPAVLDPSASSPTVLSCGRARRTPTHSGFTNARDSRWSG